MNCSVCIRFLSLALAGLPVTAMGAEKTSETGIALGNGVSGSAYLMQLSIGLMVVLVGIVVLAWFMKRMSGIQHSAGGNLRVLEGLAIGPRERIVLLQAGKDQIVVGVAQGTIQTLHVLGETVDVPEPSTTPDFAKKLSEAIKRRQEL
ncbi:MAG: flagellar biosynthetic protein FliO [Gammaproteobacteria bacterium]|nr:flagellar biosynthetic protein FliO [Gammaproteobacteria bacterium]